MLSITRSLALCIPVLLLLLACGSSPPVRFFTLSSVESGLLQDADDALILGFGPLAMPDYLNRSQMVTRAAAGEMQVDEFSRWAEPLNVALHRVVSANVDHILDGVVVVAFPYEADIRQQVNYRVLGTVGRFDADRSGQVMLEVQWSISAVGEGMVVPPRRSQYGAQASSANDPAAAAAAMNEALAQFSRDVADKLQSIIQD